MQDLSTILDSCYHIVPDASVVMPFYVYVLRCSDDTLYTGWSVDTEKRLEQHNAGKGAKYTRSRLPVVCIYSEEYSSKKEAMQREYEIKQLTRKQKDLLISPGTV
ncbi:MAG TPA: GIY-YIG nuclease family protein [Candidatus Andersenbacteria bacterium]|nr:GIY-YIG nuclease family protein [Candidatus Andersenbacteria bacterium]